jgi:hypothetical protein
MPNALCPLLGDAKCTLLSLRVAKWEWVLCHIRENVLFFMIFYVTNIHWNLSKLLEWVIRCIETLKKVCLHASSQGKASPCCFILIFLLEPAHVGIPVYTGSRPPLPPAKWSIHNTLMLTTSKRLNTQCESRTWLLSAWRARPQISNI